MNDHLSFCISGAGPIGLALALGLAQLNANVTLLDHKQNIDRQILADDRRMLALSHRSVEVFKRLGVWDVIKKHATAIDAVHVSQKNCKAEVLMTAKKQGIDHFGFLVPQGQIILALYDEICQQEKVNLLLGSKIISNSELHDGTVTINKNGEHIVQTFDWLIAAEGIHSSLRQNFGIETFTRDYDQIAVIARVAFEKPHKNIAYERFTENGPLALLPVNDTEMAVVLITDHIELGKWQKASDLTYAAEILSRIGAKLGDITDVGTRQIWPLSLMIPKKVVSGKLILAGNSAHGLHPIAGQGLNLGMRDCEAIIELFTLKRYPTTEDLIEFNKIRCKDIFQTVGATDFLVNAFGVKGPAAQAVRSLGLLGVKFLPGVKKKIASIGMGY